MRIGEPVQSVDEAVGSGVAVSTRTRDYASRHQMRERFANSKLQRKAVRLRLRSNLCGPGQPVGVERDLLWVHVVCGPGDSPREALRAKADRPMVARCGTLCDVKQIYAV